MKFITLAVLLVTAPLLIGNSATADTIGYWRFEEGSDGASAAGVNSVLDSAFSNHGTPFGNAVYSGSTALSSIPQTGESNLLSLDLDGAGDTVIVGSNAALDAATAFTVEFWMRSNDNSAGHKLLVDKSHGFVDSTGWAFQAQPGTGFIDFGIGVGGAGAGNFSIVTSQADLFDSQWHHLAGTYDGSEIEFFVDGLSQGSIAVSPFVNNTRDIRFGSASNNGRFFNGSLDEVRVSNAVLAPSQFLLSVIPEPSSGTVLLLLGITAATRRRS